MEEDSTIITENTTFLSTTDELTNNSKFLTWGPVQIENWLSSLEFNSNLIETFTFHNITGQSLQFLTEDHLKEMEIEIKDRIRLKIEINRLISNSGYIENNDELKLILSNINDLITSHLESVTRSLNDELFIIKEEMNVNKYTKPLPTPEKNNYPSSPFNLSPTKVHQSQSKSPIYQDHSHSTNLQRKPSELKHSNSITSTSNNTTSSKSARNSSYFQQQTPNSSLLGPNSPTTKVSTPHSSSIPSSSSASPHPVSEPLKQLRASTDDPCSKILQNAMKRHKLNDADWRNYALVICYGDKERILELDEKPVMIFKELREKGEHPAIMLRQRADYIVGSSQTPGGKL